MLKREIHYPKTAVQERLDKYSSTGWFESSDSLKDFSEIW
jgi:hypothetical protein